ncbi:hypothetical protein [Neorickettsia findlayensis]|uniref:Uncharacterized protein n=1 Tax=Neorickettsia findlayensis TaxID=2686014 RepID=A0A6P1GAW4_9RICK|nr:hypothetical protein [Neorickettsia findlayensis]QHD65505.1 hypothetical protein GP480_03765 [Neorickettsia findlayensis]
MFLQLYDVILGGVFFGSFSAVAAVLMSPLQFLKIMRQQTRSSYRKIALDTLSDGGLAPFFRGALPYAVMNFLSSMSFGISEAISAIALKSFFHPTILFVVLFRSMLGGLLETLFSIWAEICEISRNKGTLMENKATLRGVALPILVRNMIFWSASVVSYEISIAYHMSLLSGTAVGLIFGIFAALLSIPLDVVATRNCGAHVRHGVLACVWAVFLGKEDAKYLLYGTIIRVIQIAMFTLVTLLTMFAFEAVFHS